MCAILAINWPRPEADVKGFNDVPSHLHKAVNNTVLRSMVVTPEPMMLNGGLNNMLMHLSQLLADNCTLDLSQLRLNTGDQFFHRGEARCPAPRLQTA